MNLLQLKARVRSLTRDFSNSIFRESDVQMYLDEAIDRAKQIIPELKKMRYVKASEESPILLPNNYHHLLSVYCASRCFAQDERHYQASTLMNEFEQKFDELKTKIENGEVVIVDEDGNTVESETGTNDTDYVVDNYYNI